MEMPKDAITSKLASTGDHYIWILTEDEASRINTMLDFDLTSIGFTRTRVAQDRSPCPKCGKLSGLDDFVDNALRWGIHSREFMLEVFRRERGVEGSPSHHLQCSICQTSFGRSYDWVPAAGDDWEGGPEDETSN